MQPAQQWKCQLVATNENICTRLAENSNILPRYAVVPAFTVLTDLCFMYLIL